MTTKLVLGPFSAVKFAAPSFAIGNFYHVVNSPLGRFSAWKFSRAEFTPRVILIFISVINDISYVFFTKKIEQLFFIVHDLDR